MKFTVSVLINLEDTYICNLDVRKQDIVRKKEA